MSLRLLCVQQRSFKVCVCPLKYVIFFVAFTKKSEEVFRTKWNVGLQMISILWILSSSETWGCQLACSRLSASAEWSSYTCGNKLQWICGVFIPFFAFRWMPFINKHKHITITAWTFCRSFTLKKGSVVKIQGNVNFDGLKISLIFCTYNPHCTQVQCFYRFESHSFLPAPGPENLNRTENCQFFESAWEFQPQNFTLMSLCF